MKVSLIQRAKFKDVKKQDVTGIDMLLSYAYMGSSEFEFGALGDSLKEIARNFDSYVRSSTEFKDSEGNTVHIICKSDDVNSVKEVLGVLSEDEYPRNQDHYFKENSYFKSSLSGDIDSYSYCNCWWDLTNHWFACTGKSNAEKLMLGIQAFKKRKEL